MKSSRYSDEIFGYASDEIKSPHRRGDFIQRSWISSSKTIYSTRKGGFSWKKTKSFDLVFFLVRVTGVEPAHRKTPDPKSGASANSAIPAYGNVFVPIYNTIFLRYCQGIARLFCGIRLRSFPCVFWREWKSISGYRIRNFLRPWQWTGRRR